MLEAVGNIWDYRKTAVIAVTTGGSLTRDGRAVLGRGVARQAAAFHPALAGLLGRLLTEHGNHVHDLGDGFVSFPVEETAWSLPDPGIIARSAAELHLLAGRSGWDRIVVPRPGCGGGGLVWSEVRPLLIPWFDHRFIVISPAAPPGRPGGQR